MDNENDPMDDIEAKNFILFRNLQVLVQYQKDTRRERFCPIFDIFRYFGTQYPFQLIILDKLTINYHPWYIVDSRSYYFSNTST